jgi:hypothetical protein
LLRILRFVLITYSVKRSPHGLTPMLRPYSVVFTGITFNNELKFISATVANDFP